MTCTLICRHAQANSHRVIMEAKILRQIILVSDQVRGWVPNLVAVQWLRTKGETIEKKGRLS